VPLEAGYSYGGVADHWGEEEENNEEEENDEE
jgi:hypothetical protein